MNRRQFLGSLAGGAVKLSRRPEADRARQTASTPRRLKHWAWMRGDVKSFDDWRRSLAAMKAAGIDAVLIGGNSEFYRRAAQATSAEGLELHAWIFTLMRGDQVKTHPDWYAVNRRGVSTADKPPYVDYYRFMCPSREDVRQHLHAFVRELAGVGGLAGVHFDYVRYPDVILPVALWPKYNLVQDKEYPEFDYCYCQVCRDAFKNGSGVDPLSLEDPASHRAWLQYRYDAITEVVRLLSAEVRAAKKAATAAVFPTPAIARALVRQDWTRWPLDAVLPMVYHGFYKEDVTWIERATSEGVRAIGGRMPLYSGLYVPDLSPADLARAARFALAGGAAGISLFQGNTLTPDHWSALKGSLATSSSRSGPGGR